MMVQEAMWTSSVEDDKKWLAQEKGLEWDALPGDEERGAPASAEAKVEEEGKKESPERVVASAQVCAYELHEEEEWRELAGGEWMMLYLVEQSSPVELRIAAVDPATGELAIASAVGPDAELVFASDDEELESDTTNTFGELSCGTLRGEELPLYGVRFSDDEQGRHFARSLRDTLEALAAAGGSDDDGQSLLRDETVASLRSIGFDSTSIQAALETLGAEANVDALANWIIQFETEFEQVSFNKEQVDLVSWDLVRRAPNSDQAVTLARQLLFDGDASRDRFWDDHVRPRARKSTDFLAAIRAEIDKRVVTTLDNDEEDEDDEAARRARRKQEEEAELIRTRRKQQQEEEEDKPSTPTTTERPPSPPPPPPPLRTESRIAAEDALGTAEAKGVTPPSLTSASTTSSQQLGTPATAEERRFRGLAGALARVKRNLMPTPTKKKKESTPPKQQQQQQQREEQDDDDDDEEEARDALDPMEVVERAMRRAAGVPHHQAGQGRVPEMSCQPFMPTDFEATRILGRGSFGVVALAKRRSDGMIFAVKVLEKRRLVGQRAESMARLERDVLDQLSSTTGQLHRRRRGSNPNNAGASSSSSSSSSNGGGNAAFAAFYVAQMRFAFQSFTKLFIAMDYYPNGSLHALLQKDTPKSRKHGRRAARGVAAQLACALDHVHRACIIHRDVKPSNVLVDARGNVALSDFGLATRVATRGADLKKRSFVGTIDYAAPELLLKSSTRYNQVVDCWALGCLLYEMCAGRPPFHAPTTRETFARIVRAEPRWKNVGTDDKTRAALESLLQKDPKLRLGADSNLLFGAGRTNDSDLPAWFGVEPETIAQDPPPLEAFLRDAKVKQPDLRAPGDPDAAALFVDDYNPQDYSMRLRNRSDAFGGFGRAPSISLAAQGRGGPNNNNNNNGPDHPRGDRQRPGPQPRSGPAAPDDLSIASSTTSSRPPDDTVYV